MARPPHGRDDATDPRSGGPGSNGPGTSGARRFVTSTLALAAGVTVAAAVGWAVRGWSWDVLFPVGVVAVAWLVAELVLLLLRRDPERR